MNNKLLILFPKDTTTDFLSDVVSYLFQHVDSAKFTFTRIEPSDESHKSSLQQIEDANHAVILFLGHGTTNSLYGSCYEDYRNEKFINAKNFDIFQTKRLILVSCDSNVLIKKNKTSGFIEAIGFGDLPTDWNDIQSAREADQNAYKGFTEEMITLFRESLVASIKYSISDFLNQNLSFSDLYNLILLRTNKRIAKYFIKDRVHNLPLSDALLRMKSEILFWRNS